MTKDGEEYIPKEFTSEFYDSEYYAGTKGGKAFRRPNGRIQRWSYFNKLGEWLGAFNIARAWKIMFKPKNVLDVGCGRGTFIAYAHDVGIEAEGFDFSEWAINHRYRRCKRKWLRVHDATKPWPYPDNSYDLVVAIDLFEHIYESDLQFVIDELYRVAKKWVFLQIAVTGSGGSQGDKEEGYILKKGESVPIALEACAVAGHVVVRNKRFWLDKFSRKGWVVRDDLVERFCSLVDPTIIRNWLLNLILVLRKKE